MKMHFVLICLIASSGCLAPQEEVAEDELAASQVNDPDTSESWIQAPERASISVPVSKMREIHAASMFMFLWYRALNYGAPALNWSTDKCSNSPDKGPWFDFTNPCIRHDFGYRNYKKYNIFTGSNKAFIDSKFLQDMLDECSTRSIITRPACQGTARVYYDAVSRFGSL